MNCELLNVSGIQHIFHIIHSRPFPRQERRGFQASLGKHAPSERLMFQTDPLVLGADHNFMDAYEEKWLSGGREDWMLLVPVLLAIREQDAQRLFGNLISNAVRYANKEIRLSCHRKEKTANISVADDGPGIRPEDLPHVFERFYKGNDGKHGIGLAIAHSVAEAYGGIINARNENGAVFEVTFPTDYQQ